MKKALYTFILTLFLFSFPACEDKGDSVIPEGDVTISLLPRLDMHYESTNEKIKCTIEDAEIPLIAYSEIISYNYKEYVFNITESAKDRLRNLETPVTGLAFGVKAGDELIYTGYLWPSYSSLVCNEITADPVMLDYHRGLKIELGYPGLFEDTEIEDNRNDPRILAIFSRDNKLTE